MIAILLIVSALLGALSAAPSSLSKRQIDLPDPGQVTIGNVGYGGTGCPQGTLSSSFNSDRTAVTFIFDQYIASRGPGIPFTDSRKNCQLNVELRIPQGWQYTLSTIDYRGFMDLDRGVYALQRSRYYYQGELDEASVQTRFDGPRTQDYTIRDTFATETLVWSPCGESRNLNINASINVRSNDRRRYGFMTTDSIDKKVKHIFGFRWRRCNQDDQKTIEAEA